MKKKKTPGIHAKISLRWSLLWIVFGCWVMPVLFVGMVNSYFISNNVNNQVAGTIANSVRSNIEICAKQMDAAIRDSRFAANDTTIWEAYLEHARTGDDAGRYTKTNQFLEKQYKYNDKFRTTILFYLDDSDKLFYTFNDANDSAHDNIRSYRATHKSIRKFAKGMGTGVGFYQRDKTLYMVRNLVDRSYKPYAVLVMELDVENLFQSITTVPWATDITLGIDDGAPLPLKGVRQDIGEPQQQPLNGNNYGEDGSKTNISGTHSTDDYTLTYVVLADNSQLLHGLVNYRDTLILTMVSIVPLLLLAMLFFYQNVSRPLNVITRHAQDLEAGQLGVQIDDAFPNKEFQYMGDSFNEMSAQLKEQFDKLYREELALRDARIMALQSQINPHFLNNTLEIIIWEARLAGNAKVSGMIEALSTMLDAAMDRKSAPEVKLSEEMMYVDAYLYIVRERVGGRLAIHKEIDPALMDVRVPRLVMQPIIENAVEHGVTPLQKGNITIRVYREATCLVMEVENDGKIRPEDEGRLPELLSEDYDASGEAAHHLGIRNVNQRLRIIYGEHSGLTIEESGHNTVISKIIIADKRAPQS